MQKTHVPWRRNTHDCRKQASVVGCGSASLAKQIAFASTGILLLRWKSSPSGLKRQLAKWRPLSPKASRRFGNDGEHRQWLVHSGNLIAPKKIWAEVRIPCACYDEYILKTHTHIWSCCTVQPKNLTPEAIIIVLLFWGQNEKPSPR